MIKITFNHGSPDKELICEFPINESTGLISLSHHKVTNIVRIESDTSFDGVEHLLMPENRLVNTNNLGQFTNLLYMDLSDNRISKIQGLETLINLGVLCMSNNHVEKIQGLDAMTELGILRLDGNKILAIGGLKSLGNLTELCLSDNKLNQIRGLKTLTKLKFLRLNSNQIWKITGLKSLVNLTELSLSNNKLSKIRGLDTLVNLQKLHLENNQIKTIGGLDKLAQLKTLGLTGNKLTKIGGLDSLTLLEELRLSYNHITEINGLDKLTNLQHLFLYRNQISKITGLDTLINLRQIHLMRNRITEIGDPQMILNCTHLELFYVDDTVPIHPMIQRLIHWNKQKSATLQVFNDEQNIHNNSINQSIDDSITRLMMDHLDLIPSRLHVDPTKADVPFNPTDIGLDFDSVLTDPILTEKTKRLLTEYVNQTDIHSKFMFTFGELFKIVWKVIQESPNKDAIKRVLNEEMADSLCKCFTGRISRLINVLNGFDPRVQVQISESDAISNIIILKRKIHGDDIQALREAVRTELETGQFDPAIINEWLGYID
jgi:Leucine-rich repeat (LRR) protein